MWSISTEGLIAKCSLRKKWFCLQVMLIRTHPGIEADNVGAIKGAYQSPALLELSGIGDPRVLDRVDIKPVVNLPGVGANLRTHMSLTPVIFIAINFGANRGEFVSFLDE